MCITGALGKGTPPCSEELAWQSDNLKYPNSNRNHLVSKAGENLSITPVALAKGAGSWVVLISASWDEAMSFLFC